MTSTPLFGALLMAAVSTSAAAHSGIGIGLSEPADTIAALVSGRYCPGDTGIVTGHYIKAPCTSPPKNWPDVQRWSHTDSTDARHGDLNEDFDLLISCTFDSVNAFSQEDVDDLLERLFDEASVFGTGVRDFAVVTSYFDAGDVGYQEGGLPGGGHIELYSRCDTMDVRWKNHLDIYVAYHHEDEELSGVAPSHWIDGREDAPAESCPGPIVQKEMIGNSLLVTSYGPGTFQWKLKLAAGIFHEYGHALVYSNGSKECSNACNEIVACSASYMTKQQSGRLSVDTKYGLSVFAHSGVSQDPEQVPDNWHYRHWASWGAYLIERYKGRQWANQPLYEWVRPTHNDDIYLSPFGLSCVLDAAKYSDLGTSRTGDYRLGRLVSDYATALWIDSAEVDSVYSFGGEFHPWDDFEFFHPSEWAPDHICWEDVVPPEYVVGESVDETWIHLPGQEDCWQDAECGVQGTDPWCEPMVLKTWGANWVVFRTDTTYYDGSEDMELRVKVKWPDMYDDHRIWLSAIEYPTERDSLYKHGAEATLVRGPGAYDASDPDSILFTVSQFVEGGTEALVLVLAACETLTTAATADDTIGLFDYSISYGMFPPPGGGCPELSVRTGEGMERDNNVLAGKWGPDGVGKDSYVLGVDPAVDDGRIRLRISEVGTDWSWIDELSLTVVDHDSGEAIAVCGESGRPLLCSSHRPPLSAVIEGGPEAQDLISARDGRGVTLQQGEILRVALPSSPQQGGGLGGLVLNGSPNIKIEQPFSLTDELPSDAVDLSGLHWRSEPSTWVLPIPEGALDRRAEGTIVNLATPEPYFIDWIAAADTTGLEGHLAECPLVLATHSSRGDVVGDATISDGEAIELGQGESLDLEFALVDSTSSERTSFVLTTSGYTTDQAGANQQFSEASAEVCRLRRNSPNPFETSTSMRLLVPSPGRRASLRVYSINGRVVRTLLDDWIEGGEQLLTWDGRNESGARVAAGVYFYRLESDERVDTRKMVLLR